MGSTMKVPTFNRDFRNDIRDGRDNGYPWCCILRFAIRRDTSLPGQLRGCILTDAHCYVPCGVFHKAMFPLDDAGRGGRNNLSEVCSICGKTHGGYCG
jgi:hypothetical protein